MITMPRQIYFVSLILYLYDVIWIYWLALLQLTLYAILVYNILRAIYTVLGFSGVLRLCLWMGDL